MLETKSRSGDRHGNKFCNRCLYAYWFTF